MTNVLAISNLKIASNEQNETPWSEVPDRQLVEFCVQGLEEAWVELLHRYSRLIMRALIKTIPAYLRQPNVFRDLFQEVLAKICANSLRALREFEWRHESSLRGMLQVVSATVARDYLRRWLGPSRDMRRESSLEECEYDRKSNHSYSAIEQKILLEQLARYLWQRICDEPNHTRDIAMFLLYYGQGLRAAELARVYQLNIKTVETKLARLSRLVRTHCRLEMT